jgi:hypothetical protein
MRVWAVLLLVGVLAVQTAVAAQDSVVDKQVKVHFEKGRFDACPANYGIWIWGDEILVGFSMAYYKDLGPKLHNIDRSKPQEPAFARSVDGGETWRLENPNEKGCIFPRIEATIDPKPAEPLLRKPVGCPGGIEFTHPDFAMTLRSTDAGEGLLYYSYDRGHKWEGPFLLPSFVPRGSVPRTDYLVDGKNACTAFVTAVKSDGKEGRPLCMRTQDGGATWELVSWIGPEPKGYAIMPSTIRLSDKDILTAVRRGEGQTGFIASYLSHDNGKTWEDAGSPVASTGEGNPSCLIKLRDGRLCITYGYRAEPYSIRARLSADGGRTWGKDIVLRDDVAGRDMGYTRTVQRPDGKVVTVYYFQDMKSGPERYIGATIWDPAKAKGAN